MTKVSIIVSNYNYGEYLPQALESALNQDYPAEDLDIILIDDASTDPNTRTYVEAYQHPRVKKILLKENVGVVRARNIAIEEAKPGYIIPLDADDWFEKDYIRLAAYVLDTKPEIGIVCALGEIVGHGSGPWMSQFDIQGFLLDGGMISAPSMYRKTDWTRVGGYHEYMYHGWEDWEFWLSLLELGIGVYTLVETPGYYFRSKDFGRSMDHARYHPQELLKNIYTHHLSMYHSQPEVMVRILKESYLYREYFKNPEYRVGSTIVRPVQKAIEMVRSTAHKLKKKILHKK